MLTCCQCVFSIFFIHSFMHSSTHTHTQAHSHECELRVVEDVWVGACLFFTKLHLCYSLRIGWGQRRGMVAVGDCDWGKHVLWYWKTLCFSRRRLFFIIRPSFILHTSFVLDVRHEVYNINKYTICYVFLSASIEDEEKQQQQRDGKYSMYLWLTKW